MPMLDVNQRLSRLGPNHLPQKFDRHKGIRHTFPPGGPCNVSSMKNAVYSFGKMSAKTPSGDAMGTYLVMADWCGNWFFDFYIVEPPGSSGAFGAGFVFNFSTDKVGRGYTI